MKGDSNSYLVGKHVAVTQVSFKNYQGHIKSTMGDGRVLVELKVQMHHPQPFNLASLHLKHAFIYVLENSSLNTSLAWMQGSFQQGQESS